MDMHQLEHDTERLGELELNVIASVGNQLYQIECRDDRHVWLLERKGRPQLFRSLDAAFDVLRTLGVKRAFLVEAAQIDIPASERTALAL